MKLLFTVVLKFETTLTDFPADIYLSKANSGNIRTMHKIYLKLTIKTAERRQKN